MVVVEPGRGPTAADRSVEVVERKGIGHPDTICDGVAEAVSLALCREYLREFGAVLHHNVDKALLAAGRVETGFGGGRVVRPMRLYVGDRGTAEVEGRRIPVDEIAREAARAWLGGHLRHVDPGEHVRCEPVLEPGSAELAGIFASPGGARVANDTSAAVGYFPLTPTERAVLGVERHLNSDPVKETYLDTGEDVKVMGVRRGGRLELTVAVPLLAGCVRSEREYFERVEVLTREVVAHVERDDAFDEVEVRLNALDRRGAGRAGVYLTLLGTSAEGADSGQVGRGNRVNGIIPVTRAIGTEAAAGKNPVSHVGKIYNVLAHRAAREVHAAVEGLREVQVVLVSRIGAPLDEPALAGARLVPLPGDDVAPEQIRDAEEVLRGELARMDEFCGELTRGEYPVF